MTPHIRRPNKQAEITRLLNWYDREYGKGI